MRRCLVKMRDVKPVSHYKQGPQGNTVPDHYADFKAMYGEAPKNEILGTPGLPDLRDNRDPAAVGNAVLAERQAIRIAGKAKGNGAAS